MKMVKKGRPVQFFGEICGKMKGLEKIFLLLFLLLPWSVEVDFGFWKMNLPSEILILAAAVLLFFRMDEISKFGIQNPNLTTLSFRRNLPKNEFKISISNLGRCLQHDNQVKNSGFGFFKNFNYLLVFSSLWIFWLAVSTVFSTMPLVSLKYFIVEFGQWMVFFLGIFCFPKLWEKALPLFIFSMVGVVGFSMTTHFFYDFRPDQSNLAPMPFFSDHTMYSAVLAMLLPWVFIIPGRSRWAIFAIFLVGIFFSFCRAAWLSVAAIGLIYLGIFLFSNLKIFKKSSNFGLAILLFALFSSVFYLNLNKNTSSPADGNARDVASQIRSMTNFTTDVSNLERLNRFRCALRMAADRPIFGFGIGTFQFQYLKYQRPPEMTRLSITEPILERKPSNFGRGGEAHSEYLKALAETGLPGFLIWMAMAGLAVFTCLRGVFSKNLNENERKIYVVALLSLTTFLIHGLANNFLHDGRVAALFWGQLAFLEGGIYSARTKNGSE